MVVTILATYIRISTFFTRSSSLGPQGQSYDTFYCSLCRTRHIANVLFKTDEGSHNWCMGLGAPVALPDEPGISYIALADLAELLVPDIAFACSSRIQICVSSFINVEARYSLLDLRHSIASIFSKVITSGAAEAKCGPQLETQPIILTINPQYTQNDISGKQRASPMYR
jgi:hypothetical protein